MLACGSMKGAVRTILECIGEDPERPGLLDTPGRVTKALEYMTSGYSKVGQSRAEAQSRGAEQRRRAEAQSRGAEQRRRSAQRGRQGAGRLPLTVDQPDPLAQPS